MEEPSGPIFRFYTVFYVDCNNEYNLKKQNSNGTGVPQLHWLDGGSGTPQLFPVSALAQCLGFTRCFEAL